ncbi:MAG: OmpA family protein [Gammaproteobacteria bacterium]|jgi:chemotaxis protein MotB
MTYKSWLYPVGIIVLAIIASGCVSQGSYDAVVQERDKLQKENRAMQQNMKLTRNQKEEVKQDLEATTEALIITSEELQETKIEAMTTAVLYDKLVNKLAIEVESQQITIEQMKSGVNLNLPEGILFDSGSADVKKSGEVVLHKLAKELWDVPYQTIVAGFTDNVPISKRLQEKFPSNWDLAASRATNVVMFLEESGVPKEKLVVVSLGENQPVASNDTKEGRAQNRRIEIRLRPVVIE